jgi:hypothetical protein
VSSTCRATRPVVGGCLRAPFDRGVYAQGSGDRGRPGPATWPGRGENRQPSPTAACLDEPSTVVQTSEGFFGNLQQAVGHQPAAHRAEGSFAVGLLPESAERARYAHGVLGMAPPGGTRQIYTDYGEHSSLSEQAENPEAIHDLRRVSPEPGRCAEPSSGSPPSRERCLTGTITFKARHRTTCAAAPNSCAALSRLLSKADCHCSRGGQPLPERWRHRHAQNP